MKFIEEKCEKNYRNESRQNAREKDIPRNDDGMKERKHKKGKQENENKNRKRLQKMMTFAGVKINK